MDYNYLLLIIFIIIAYMIIIDPNVGRYIVILYNILLVNLQRYWWMIKLHPKNPIQKYLIWRRSWIIAEKMMKELEEKSKQTEVDEVE